MNDESDKQSIRPRKQRVAFHNVLNFPLVETSVYNLMEELGVAENFRETLAKLLRLLMINYTTHKTYENASTQTPLDWHWENDKVEVSHEQNGTVQSCHEESKTVESSDELSKEETEPKVVVNGDCHAAHTANTTQESPYDNVTFTASHYGNHSLQIQGRRETEQLRRQSAVEINIGTYDERECLANALQFNITELVDGVIFQDSELPDCLLAEGCVTEDECSCVRRIRDRKDQIRTLVSLINGRDLRVLKGFLKYITQHNQDVADKIRAKFEQNKRQGLGQKACFLCQLKNNFNVRHLADSLWAIQVIDKGFYNTIISSELPIGAQETLWRHLIHSLNYLEDNEQANLAHRKVLVALSRYDLFKYLADGIQDMLIKNHGMLSCFCPRKFMCQRGFTLTGSTSEESTYPKSSSDETTNDLSSTRRTNDRTYCKTLYNRSDTMTTCMVEEKPLFTTSLFTSSHNHHDIRTSIPESITEEGTS